MKKSVLILMALALCLALAIPALAGEHCLKVLLDGTIKLRFKNPKAAPKDVHDALLACRTNGKFHIELIFPEKGGQVLSQKNWVAITGFDCSHNNDRRYENCRQKVDPQAFKPHPFTLTASLKPVGSSHYDLEFRMKRLPPSKPVRVTIQCPNTTIEQMNDYGSKYRQLVLPTYLDKIMLSMVLGQKHHRPSRVRDLPPFELADLEWDELITLVPCCDLKSNSN